MGQAGTGLFRAILPALWLRQGVHGLLEILAAFVIPKLLRGRDKPSGLLRAKCHVREVPASQKPSSQLNPNMHGHRYFDEPL